MYIFEVTHPDAADHHTTLVETSLDAVNLAVALAESLREKFLHPEMYSWHAAGGLIEPRSIAAVLRCAGKVDFSYNYQGNVDWLMSITRRDVL